MPISTNQARAIQLVHQAMVERGVHPSVAGRIVRRAADRVLAHCVPGGCGEPCCDEGWRDGGIGYGIVEGGGQSSDDGVGYGIVEGGGSASDDGMGRIQMRSLRRDLFPGLPPRPVMAGEQCIRIQETPGSETAVYQQLNEYRNRGWNVIEMPRTRGFQSVAVYWACPPGQMPRESQTQVLDSKPYGPPLYV